MEANEVILMAEDKFSQEENFVWFETNCASWEVYGRNCKF